MLGRVIHVSLKEKTGEKGTLVCTPCFMDTIGQDADLHAGLLGENHMSWEK